MLEKNINWQNLKQSYLAPSEYQILQNQKKQEENRRLCLTAEILYKQFGPRSGPTEHPA